MLFIYLYFAWKRCKYSCSKCFCLLLLNIFTFYLGMWLILIFDFWKYNARNYNNFLQPTYKFYTHYFCFDLQYIPVLIFWCFQLLHPIINIFISFNYNHKAFFQARLIQIFLTVSQSFICTLFVNIHVNDYSNFFYVCCFIAQLLTGWKPYERLECWGLYCFFSQSFQPFLKSVWRTDRW